MVIRPWWQHDGDMLDHLSIQVADEPRVWPEYHPGYFGAFVRDPDANNVEAVHHTFES